MPKLALINGISNNSRISIPAVDRLHFEIQKEANQLTEPAKLWTIGESCLVFCVLSMNSPECWFRAKVESFECLEPLLVEVFLIDIGLKVLSELKNLRTIPDQLMRQSPAAIKMHMPGVLPTGGRVSWTVSSIEMFQDTVNKFESIYVSIVGDSDDDSLPVVVWGVTEEGIAMRPQRQFHNVMAFLHERGYIDYNVQQLEELMKHERPISDKHFGWKKTVLDNGSVEDLVEESDQESSDDDYEEPNIETAGGTSIRMVPKAITSWLPSDADISEKFIGYATNVDDSGLIFVQNEEQRSIAQTITKAINDVYSKVLTNFSAKVTEGQAVIVHNKIDGGELKLILLIPEFTFKLFCLQVTIEPKSRAYQKVQNPSRFFSLILDSSSLLSAQTFTRKSSHTTSRL